MVHSRWLLLMTPPTSGTFSRPCSVCCVLDFSLPMAPCTPPGNLCRALVFFSHASLNSPQSFFSSYAAPCPGSPPCPASRPSRASRASAWGPHLLAVQGTLKSLLQHYISKASILRCSSFFIVQLSHPYITTEKPYL